VLQVRRSVYENARGRQPITGSSNTTGNSITAARIDSRPVTSSCGFRSSERTAVTSGQPVARMRRGVLSQLPVSPPEAVTSATAWNKRRRRSTRSNVVTTDYGWIDTDQYHDEESDKENHGVDTEKHMRESRFVVISHSVGIDLKELGVRCRNG